MSKKLFLICPKVWNSIKNQVNVNAWREKDGILKCMKAGRRALYEYGPYGSAVKMEGNAAELNPFRFSSEYADDELGLVYYNYRYYNPQNGRWISRDPADEQSGWNLYIFVKNNTCLYSDTLGLSEDSETECCKDGVKYSKIADDAGRECCEYEIQEIFILVKPCSYWSGNVGHAWVDRKSVV